jgi:hypothetical protein
VTQPRIGLFDGLSSAEYHADEAIGSSHLSDMALSAAHYHALHLAPGRPVRTETPAMKAGTLLHCMALEPTEAAARYIVKPDDIDMRTKAGKAWAESVGGKTIITSEQAATADSQVSALCAVPEIARLLADCVTERSAFWIDAATGQRCKCRPDIVHTLPDGRVILGDVKTTQDASPEAFARSVWKFGYHRQAEWYSSGYAHAAFVGVAAFVFCVVTNDYPFIAVPYMLDDAAQQLGAQACAQLLGDIATCKTSNTWPAYGQGVQVLSLPTWATTPKE